MEERTLVLRGRDHGQEGRGGDSLPGGTDLPGTGRARGRRGNEPQIGGFAVKTRRGDGNSVETEGERVLMVGVQLPADTEAGIENSLEELERLIDTLGGQVVETVIAKRKAPSPAMYIGKGKAEEI